VGDDKRDLCAKRSPSVPVAIRPSRPLPYGYRPELLSATRPTACAHGAGACASNPAKTPTPGSWTGWDQRRRWIAPTLLPRRAGHVPRGLSAKRTAAAPGDGELPAASDQRPSPHYRKASPALESAASFALQLNLSALLLRQVESEAALATGDHGRRSAPDYGTAGPSLG